MVAAATRLVTDGKQVKKAIRDFVILESNTWLHYLI
jgi:hypothetical protein